MENSNFILSMDCGGTFTDTIAVRGNQVELFKVATTPHDLTVSFNQAISDVAEAWEMTPIQLLARTAAIRFATTVGTNAIINRSGPKIDLMDEGCFK